jgi:hypothetical protein
MAAVNTAGIHAFHKAMATAGIPVFLQGGALLGMVRDGAPIGWDKDVDFGVFDADWSRYGAKELMEAGFSFSRDFKDDKGHYQSRWNKDGVQYDLFHYYHRNGTVYMPTWGPQGAFALWWHPFTPQPFKLGGFTVLSPGDPVVYLEHQYGDWRTPKPKWVYWRDPLNMEAL